MSSPKYASYYDCSNWNSSVEVMNLQDQRADFHIFVYRRDGSTAWEDSRTLSPHETDRISLDDTEANGEEGLVVVQPEPEYEGAEFPSLLTICDEGRHWKLGNRFVPFIRVP